MEGSSEMVKAKDETDYEYLSPQPQSYLKTFGELRVEDAVKPECQVECYRIRIQDLLKILGNEDQKLRKIHVDSGATILVSSENENLPRRHPHAILELLGTVNEVTIAEILIVDAIKETYEEPWVPKSLMPRRVYYGCIMIPTLKVVSLLGDDGKNITEMEAKYDVWIEVETSALLVDEGSASVYIYGPHAKVTVAIKMIKVFVYGGENESSAELGNGTEGTS